MSEQALRAYLAGPEVFLPDAIAIGKKKKQLCARYGLEGLFPFDNEVAPDASGKRTDLLIYRANVLMMHRADLGIFNLTPFRGPSADVGTVFELGMLVGLGKPVFGYTNDDNDFLARIKQATSVHFDPNSRTWRDLRGMAVENYGNSDNLMLDATFSEQSHPVIRHSTTEKDRFRDLTAFESCLQLAVDSLMVANTGSFK